MRNTIKRTLAFALMIFTLFSCAFAENGDKVVATYNGGEVTLKEVESDIAAEMNLMTTTMSYYYQLAGKGAYNVTEEDKNSVRQYVVEAYAKYEILLNKMKELNIDDLTEEEKNTLRVNAEYFYLQNVYSYVQQGMSADEAAYYLNMQGMTIDSVYESSYRNAIQMKIVNALSVDENVAEKDILSKYETLTADYEKTYASAPLSVESYANDGQTVYFMPENMRYIKHIILMPEDEALSNELSEAADQLSAYKAEYASLTSESYEPRYDEIVEKAIKEECLENIELSEKTLEEIQAKVLEAVMPKANLILDAIKNGESFDSLIETYSNDPGSLKEPIKSKGYLVYKDSTVWDEAFVNAANALENVGDVSEPTVGSLGVYIVKFESEPAVGKAALETVRDAVISSIITERKTEAFNTQSAVWFEEANIQVNLDAFN
ncbi:MAG: peptidylprolyl isomerase [Clostridia bacterium]|nr:peptidylprolyl isomerase [Clostridia bacterium]